MQNIDKIYAQARRCKQAAKQTHCPHNRLHANIQCIQSDPTQAMHATCMHASDQYSCTRPACTQLACMHPTSIHIPDQCACIQRTNSPQVTQAPTAKHAVGASYNISRRGTFGRVKCELTHRQQNVPISLPGSNKTPKNLFN